MSGSCWEVSRQAALSNSAQVVKASQGQFGGYFVYNPNDEVSFLQLYDSAGAVVVGTTTPKASYGIPAGAGANIEIKRGVACLSGIKVAATTTMTGGTAPDVGLDVNIYYT